MPQNQRPQEIPIKANDEDLKGRYANALSISHNESEFYLDFMLLLPPAGQVVSRIITNPGHMKRILAALEENLKIYEKNFGKIEVAKGPQGEGEIGFKTN